MNSRVLQRRAAPGKACSQRGQRSPRLAVCVASASAAEDRVRLLDQAIYYDPGNTPAQQRSPQPPDQYTPETAAKLPRGPGQSAAPTP